MESGDVHITPTQSYERLEHELNLKQLQLKSLLAITQAINDNVSADTLFQMYKTFINWDMRVDRMALYICDGDEWQCATFINEYYDFDSNNLLEKLESYSRLQMLKGHENDPVLSEFDMVIPVRHKGEPLSYTLIGGFHDDGDPNIKAQFIQTITNIITVAIENKRLFKRQLNQERVDRMMEVAGEVQHMFIPEKLPSNEKVELNGIYRPHFNIGGDYFDYFMLSEDEVIFCIADISGKGIGAAMVMANFQGVLHNMVRKYDRLDVLVRELNKTVFSLTQSDKFISFFIAKVDTAERSVNYVNAGHCPVACFKDKKVEFWQADCTVLGATPDLNGITSNHMEYASGAMLVAYTDGMTELKNEKGEFFDEDHLTLFGYTHAERSAADFNDKLLERLNHFRGGQAYHDDIAVLTCLLK